MIPVRLCRMVICVNEPNVAFVMRDLVAYRSKVPSCDHKGLLSCAYIGLIRTFEQQHRGELFWSPHIATTSKQWCTSGWIKQYTLVVDP